MSQPLAMPPPPPPPPAPASQSTQAVVALVLGILGLICCSLMAPVAWYLGVAEGRAIREGRSPAGGQGLATAGKILGIIGTVFMVFIVLWIVFMGGLAVLQGLANNR
jgi:Domain of unknown function (DUF4190)